MEFSIDRAELVSTLALAQGVVERRHAMPVLANVLIEAGTKLAITASDLEVHVRKQCAARIVEGGTATVGARRLFDFVRELAPGDVRIRALENHFVEISSGRSRVKLVGLPASDFPAFPKADHSSDPTLALSLKSLGQLVDRTLFAVSADETRTNLSGVYLSVTEGTLRACGTDGHRLALIEYPVKDPAATIKGVILPRKGLAELRKLVDDGEGEAQVTFSSTTVRVEKGPVELLMRLIDGDFPNYEQVVPSSSKHEVTLEKAALLSALRRVAVVASDRARGVRLELSPTELTVSANSPDFGEAREEIETSATDANLTVGFNARYLTEVLSVLPDDQRVKLGLTDDESPGIISAEEDDSYRYVVMPMRL